MAHQIHFEKPKYKQWVKAGFGLEYLKEGLSPFCKRIAGHHHRDMLKNIRDDLKCKCGGCEDGICCLIEQKHVAKKPNWKNADTQQLKNDPWSAAKCYIHTPGYRKKATANDTDCSGLLHIILNNEYFHSHISSSIVEDPNNIFAKVRDDRNSIFNSSSQTLEEVTANSYIDDMITILQDPKELKTDLAAQQAVRNLKDLKNKDFMITSEPHETLLKQVREFLMQELKEVESTLSTYKDKSENLTTNLSNIEELLKQVRGDLISELNERKSTVSTKEEVEKIDRKIEELSEQKIIMSHRVEESPDEKTKSVSWNDCISYAKLLVKRKTLPSQSEVNKACRVFERHSTILSDMCTLIAEHIKKKSPDVTSVWPAFVAEDNIISVVFVVMKKESNVLELEGYDCKLSFEDQYNDESKLVASEKLKNESIYKQYADDLKQMRACINKNADALFNRHSNLNVILPSLIKSTGYKSGKHVIKVMPCIALYVTSKGYIPLKEEPFEKEIGAFPIDILEGDFRPFEDLKIGSAVCVNQFQGTLGGFVDHPKHGLCGLTCAHVIYNNKELKDIHNNIAPKEKMVYQGEESSAFGKAVLAVFDEGTETVPGVEVALIKIQQRRPIDGSFPIIEGSDDTDQLRFNSGNVCETANLDFSTVVYKFGIESKLTKGKFWLQGAALRKKHADSVLPNNFRYYLKDQIVICSLQSESKFALPGDSGALVLKKENEDSVAIGLLVGGLKTGEVLVTPICDILRAVGCTEVQMYNFNE